MSTLAGRLAALADTMNLDARLEHGRLIRPGIPTPEPQDPSALAAARLERRRVRDRDPATRARRNAQARAQRAARKDTAA